VARGPSRLRLPLTHPPADGAADTATVIAVSAARGGYVPMTTVQQNTSFQRPIVGADALVTARVTKAGRTLAFADVTITANGALAAQATTVYALLPPPA
jgi:acyl-coenzyme A thioesterase PaaI-like protein